MKRKRQAGQAFILVLIILAIGALVVVPTLRLTTTVLQSSQTITQRNKGLYACEAAQQKIMWMLFYDTAWRTTTFQNDKDSVSFTVDVCGTTVYAGITMRAVEGTGGVCLSGDGVIRPTKELTDVDPIEPVLPGATHTFTYTITLDHVSDNTSVKLDAIYDVLPQGFQSVAYEGPTELSVDGGVSWEQVPHPDSSVDKLLKWPADYDLDTGTGNFSSNAAFLGIQDFTPGQEKMLRFKVTGKFKDEGVYHNWVVLKPWSTPSGATAPITVGTPSDNTSHLGMLEADSTAVPALILPGVSENVTYTITITNLRDTPLQIKEIIDYLPPEFYYTAGFTSLIRTDQYGNPEPILILDPWETSDNICGAARQVLRWTTSEFPDYNPESPDDNTVRIDEGGTLTLTFRAQTTKDVSGTYYNEVFVVVEEGMIDPETGYPEDLPEIFGDIGVEWTNFGGTYSWNSGSVIVPAYDSSTGAEGENITANLSLEPDQVRIISWHPQ